MRSVYSQRGMFARKHLRRTAVSKSIAVATRHDIDLYLTQEDRDTITAFAAEMAALSNGLNWTADDVIRVFVAQGIDEARKRFEEAGTAPSRRVLMRSDLGTPPMFARKHT
jgi:uncharacterized protein (DUF2164 family)